MQSHETSDDNCNQSQILQQRTGTQQFETAATRSKNNSDDCIYTYEARGNAMDFMLGSHGDAADHDHDNLHSHNNDHDESKDDLKAIANDYNPNGYDFGVLSGIGSARRDADIYNGGHYASMSSRYPTVNANDSDSVISDATNMDLATKVRQMEAQVRVLRQHLKEEQETDAEFAKLKAQQSTNINICRNISISKSTGIHSDYSVRNESLQRDLLTSASIRTISDNYDRTAQNDSSGRSTCYGDEQFPLRRTVFVYGIPPQDDPKALEFLHDMLKPFGQITKIQFDDGDDSIDRKMGQRFLSKPRVYKLTVPRNAIGNGVYVDSRVGRRQLEEKQDETNMNGCDTNDHDNKMNEYSMESTRIEMNFYTKSECADAQLIQCHRCPRSKRLNINEGFYGSKDNSLIYCIQCAAVKAERQLGESYKIKDISKKNVFLGKPANTNGENMRTALVVFESQKHASRCSYVRTRIAYRGAFAAFFHHYSKVKKDIISELVLSQKPSI